MTALGDQAAAAAAHAEKVFYSTADAMGQTPDNGPAAGPILTLLDRWRTTPPITRCAHLASPQPIIGLLPLVGEITCVRPACTLRHRERYFRLISRKDCDACRKPSPGNRFREFIVHGGYAIIAGNVCRACFALACPDDPGDPPDLGDRVRAMRTEMHAAGRCAFCAATSERAPHPFVRGLTVVKLFHDSWCPTMNPDAANRGDTR
jgi:hypothetical protein